MFLKVKFVLCTAMLVVFTGYCTLEMPLSDLNIYVGVAGLVCRSQLKLHFRGEDMLYASMLSFLFCVDCR